MESSDKEDYEAKDKAFYIAMLNGWLNTRLERDKQLLGLSVTAIGLLVTLLRTVGASSNLQITLYDLALPAFLITVVSIIFILGENSKHIEEILESSETENKTLLLLDKAAEFSFIAGMILIVMIGISSATIHQSEKGTSMSQNKPFDYRQDEVNEKSWNGAAKLRPQPPKSSQTNPSTESSATNPLATSGGNGSNGPSESSNS